ncbi:MAG: hypothetical protein ABW099_00435 [Candidatus Binatia bacterium]
MDRTCDYRTEFSRNLRHRQKVYCVLSVTAQDTPSLVSMVVQTERKMDGTMADMQLQNGSRFLVYALGKQALSAFTEQQNNWDKLE